MSGGIDWGWNSFSFDLILQLEPLFQKQGDKYRGKLPGGALVVAAQAGCCSIRIGHQADKKQMPNVLTCNIDASKSSVLGKDRGL